MTVFFRVVATIAALSMIGSWDDDAKKKNSLFYMSDAFVVPLSVTTSKKAVTTKDFGRHRQESQQPQQKCLLLDHRCRVRLMMTLEPLAKEGEWAAYLDKDNTEDVYYFNEKTGESRWDPPTETFPNVTTDNSVETTSSSSSSQKTKRNVLVREGEWAAYLDETTTGMIYYFNSKTGESSWEPPTSTFPKIKMTKRDKEKMMAKRRAYAETLRTTTTTADNEKNDKNQTKKQNEQGFLSSILQLSTKPSTTTTATVAKEETTPSKKENKQPTEEAKDVTEEEEEETKKGKSSGGGIFNMFSSSKIATKEDAQEVVDTTPDVTEPEPSQKDEKKMNTFGFNLFGSSSATTIKEPSSMDMEPTITETPKQKKITKPIFSTTTEKKTNVEKSKKQPEPEPVEEEEEEEQTPVQMTSSSTTGFMNFFNPSKPKQKMEVIEEEEEPTVVVKPIKIEMSARVLPHPEKVSWGGEDAIFTSARTFGVFDGVSGAEKAAGVPLYSVTLAQQMKKRVGKTSLTIEEITTKMLEAAEYADERATGASTSLVASIGEDGFLRLLNVGDCAAVVIRDGKIVSRSKEVIHFFDCPYQLSIDSPDRPKDGSVLQIEVIAGDIIVSGSDGIFDNLTDDILIDTVYSSIKAPLICNKLVSTARTISFDPQAETPYAKLARRKGYDDYRDGLGGKVDDISCIVVKVS